MSDAESPSQRRPIEPTTSTLTSADRWDHVLARIGVRRMQHCVQPGLYALGHPGDESPVCVTANYALSFDALRAALAGIDAYILVLDTQGVNVWCAAGEGTFGTEEVLRQVAETGLQDVVRHRVLILPQLGAPGVAAHEVKKQSGFKVEYGPVRAADLPEYLKTRRATPEMRRVRFTLGDRMAVATVDVVAALLPMLAAAVVFFFIGGLLASAAVIAAMLAGVLLFPALLPWLPTRHFSSKGLILGGVVALPFALATFLQNPTTAWWMRAAWALAYMLCMPPATAYLALMFTGSTTFTSRTGVRREIFRYIPVMAWLFGLGFVMSIALRLWRAFGGQA
jgi:hypothetical protein